jgi:hypothetical protein
MFFWRAIFPLSRKNTLLLNSVSLNIISSGAIFFSLILGAREMRNFLEKFNLNSFLDNNSFPYISVKTSFLKEEGH